MKATRRGEILFFQKEIRRKIVQKLQKKKIMFLKCIRQGNSETIDYKLVFL
jgi:hypothetical protein